MTMDTKRDARRLGLHAKESLQRRIVCAGLEQRLRKAKAVRVLDVSQATRVHSLVALPGERGEDGLKPKRPGPARVCGQLKGWQAATIVNLIKDCCLELQLPFALWTREAVHKLIKIRFGIAYSLGMMGRLLRRWGFAPQKPVTRACMPDLNPDESFSQDFKFTVFAAHRPVTRDQLIVDAHVHYSAADLYSAEVSRCSVSE